MNVIVYTFHFLNFNFYAKFDLLLFFRQYFSDESFWASLCDKSYALCSQGSFVPSGVLIKAMLLHSGKQVNNFLHTSTISLKQFTIRWLFTVMEGSL